MKLMIAGGGTGGHVFTGIAVARELAARKAKHEVVFVGTESGLEAKLVPQANFRLVLTRAPKLKGLAIGAKIKGLLLLPLSLLDGLRILLRERPDCVFGVGGYASGPIILMATFLFIPTAIIEQNSIPGFTNRVLGRFVRRIFLAFDHARKYFPSRKCFVTGNPIRREVLEDFLRCEKAPKVQDRFTLLIFGGSQGAERMDRIVLEAIPYLKDLSPRLAIVQQTGMKFFEALKKAYAENQFCAQVLRFIDEMGRIYAQADLVICRSGAISVSEVATLGKPAIFIPFPFATDNHQEANARTLADRGGGVILLERDLTPLTLSETIRSYLEEPQRRKAMGQRALQFSSWRAAREIVDSCLLMLR